MPDQKREIFSTSRSKTTSTETQRKKHVRLKRPNTLSLRYEDGPARSKIRSIRSDSIRSSERSLTKVTADVTGSSDAKVKTKRESEEEHIYVISNKDDDNYDSIEVIDERRMKMFSKIDPNRKFETNSSICEEFYLSSTAAKPAENVNDNHSNDQLPKT